MGYFGARRDEFPGDNPAVTTSTAMYMKATRKIDAGNNEHHLPNGALDLFSSLWEHIVSHECQHGNRDHKQYAAGAASETRA